MAPILKFRQLSFCLFLLLCALVLFAACTDRTEVVPEPSEQIGTVTPDLPATSTPTAVPSATIAALPDPSPAATAAIIPATASPSPPTSTPADKSLASDEKLATSSSQSADGRWLAEGWLAFIVEDGILIGYDTKLQVSQTGGSITWTLKDYVQNAGLGVAIPEIVHWSSDGRHAYFTNRTIPDGCGDFVNGTDLFRADLETGEVVELMPPLARSLSLSPDESTVAYLPWGPMPDLVLRSVATGSQRTLVWDTPFDVAGDIVWSPDGQNLALTLSSTSCPFPDRTHTIVLVDVQTLTPSVLLENDRRQYVTAAWSETGDLILQDLDGVRWALDVTTGAIMRE